MGAEVLWPLVLLALPLLAWWWRGREARARLSRCGELIPGPRPLPLLGNALDAPTDPKKLADLGNEFRRKYGPTVRFWAGPLHLVVILGDPRDVEMLLSSTKNLNKAFNYNFVHSWLGQGLLTSTGSKWKKHRKIITPTFHFKILANFVSIFHEQGEILISQLKKIESGATFDISPMIDLCTQDVICDSAMGVKLHAQTKGYGSSYVKAVKDMCELILGRSTKPWLYLDLIYTLSSLGRKERKHLRILHGLTDEVIRRRREHLKGVLAPNEILDEVGMKKRLAFLDLLLLSTRNDESLSLEDIRDEVDTFMFEGHDTTASAISFALMELSRNPDIQDKIFHELKEVTGKNDGGLLLSMETLHNLKYLEKVIKEILRLYPSIPLYGRQLTEELELATLPVTLPAGVSVIVDPTGLHRHPEHYSDPERFNPENFSSEAILKRDAYSYLPFSAGPRNCIGQKFAMLEIKSILAKIIWNFSLQIDPEFQLQLVWEITMKSLNGIRLSVSPRLHD